MSNRQEPAAAPPDDGGHQGSYTTPDQTMEAHSSDRPPRAPALHRDGQRTSGSGWKNPVWMLAAVLALIGIIAFFLLVRS